MGIHSSKDAACLTRYQAPTIKHYHDGLQCKNFAFEVCLKRIMEENVLFASHLETINPQENVQAGGSHLWLCSFINI